MYSLGETVYAVQYSQTVTVTVAINGLVKLLAFYAHICPFKYPVSFETRNGICEYYIVW